MSVPVLYCSPHLDASGYGEASRNAIMALRAGGADIKTQRISFTGNVNYKTASANVAQELETREVDYKIKIIHTTPDVYKNYIEPGKYHIGHLFWETDKLPKSWVSYCNMMNEIWTGTELNKNIIKSSGVTVPVFVYPQSIDTLPHDVKPYKLPNFNGYLFYSIFEWNERKNPRTLLNAYWKEFKGEYDVGLLIKTHKSTYSESGLNLLMEEIKRWKNELGWKDTPRVFIHSDISTEEEMRRIHKTGNCYVSSHRGEGWGLPIAEACMYKNPIISVKYGGICEYFNAKTFYEVKHELVPIDKVYGKYYEPGMLWAQADELHLREQMRKIFELSKSTKQHRIPLIRAGTAKSMIARQFNYESVGRLMVARLQDIQSTL